MTETIKGVVCPICETWYNVDPEHGGLPIPEGWFVGIRRGIPMKTPTGTAHHAPAFWFQKKEFPEKSPLWPIFGLTPTDKGLR